MSETVRSLPAVGLIAVRLRLSLPSVLPAHLPQSSASVQPPPGDTQTFLFLISSPSENSGTVCQLEITDRDYLLYQRELMGL